MLTQAQNGKAPASRYGIGELHPFTSVRERGMGSAGVSNASHYTISQSNPALWSQVSNIRLQADMVFEKETLDMNDQSFGYSTARIKSLQLSFPVSDDYGMSIVGGIVPVSRTDYEVSGFGLEKGQEFKITYAGTGGISAFRFGSSVKPISSLYLGVSYQYYFGTIDQNWDVDFTNPEYFDSHQSRATAHSGSGVLLGAYYTGIKNLSVGASFSPSVSLDASRNLVYSYPVGDSLAEGASGSLDIPSMLTAGASYQFGPSLLFAVEYMSQDWTDATIFDQKQKQLDKAYKIGAGIEWIPGEVGDTDLEYWKQLALRLGFYNAQGYIGLDDEYQKQYVLSAGLGLPIIGTNRADLALEYGWHGAAEELAGKRSFIRLSISISAGESWYKRRSAYDY
jgi:hypothetical protein